MATNERFIPVPPEAVWSVLADAGSFGYWVVGSKVIRDAEPEWPRPGSKFHHTVGFGPLTISDHTVSLEAEPPRLLEMRAKTRPLATARVKLELTPLTGGTLVKIKENPDQIFAVLALNPLLQLLVKARNAESLMRLEDLALREHARAGGAAAASPGRRQAPTTA